MMTCALKKMIAKVFEYKDSGIVKLFVLEGPAPFEIPTNEDMFRKIIESKEATHEEQCKAEAEKKVFQRSTFASRMQAISTKPISAVTSTFVDPLPKYNEIAFVKKEGSLRTVKDETFLKGISRFRRKETVSEFLAKKREIFLVQMNLDSKRLEIYKLEQRALQREEALRQNEAMLEEDAVRFDAFLKENDEKVQLALKDAEAQTIKKQEKVLLFKDMDSNCV